MSGRVLLGGPKDTVPLGNTWVVLHRITRDSGAPLDSIRSDAHGRYHLTLNRPDSAVVYVVSAWYDSIAYFSLPLNVIGRPAVHVEDLITFATTINAPPIALERRLATVASANASGTREVLEILELQNAGATTRVTKDTLVPTWAGRVPAGVGQMRGGQGDISPDAMVFRHDSVLVLGPIPPGPIKQLSYAYSLPEDVRTFVIPIDQATGDVNLLIEDTTAVVSGAKLDTLGVQELEQRRFAAYRAGPLKGGERIEIQLPAGKFRAQHLLPYIIALLAVAMVLALVWALRRRPPAPKLT
ncbi:MAG TPA: hypothetical protein VL549_08915 [Gemmatimonadales bacterium]|nr:hypothetical protein [Gemmatimonadales bacterium]